MAAYRINRQMEHLGAHIHGWRMEVRRMPSRSKQWAKLRASFSPRARSSALPLQDFSGPQFPCLHIAFPEQLFLVFRLADLAAAGIRQCLQHSTAVTALVHHQIKGIVNGNRDVLEELATQLLEKETLLEKDLERIFAPVVKQPIEDRKSVV